MRFVQAFCLTVTVLCAATVHGFDFSGNEVFIPILTRVPGLAGTQWRTDLVISSRSELQAASVALIYDAVGRSPIQHRIALQPRQTVTIPDVVREVFGHEESFGTLWIGSETAGVRIVAHARVYNAGNAAGEFGQVVTGLPIEQLSRVVWLNGLIGVRGNRTNAGIANPNNAPAFFTLAWFDQTGELRGTGGLFEIEPWGIMLINDVFAFTGVPAAEGLTLKIRSNVPIYALASVVRNDTGDAYTIVGDGRNDD